MATLQKANSSWASNVMVCLKMV